MRNLKKVLSLVLAMAMMLSVMVVGAGAASLGDYTDNDKVSAEYAVAVDVASQLGILEGVGANKYNPQGNLTRAQLATMVYRMTTADVTDVYTANFAGGAAENFTDTPADAWYAGYVGYAADAEFLKGVGDDLYKPNSYLTGYQALAAFLRGIGYNEPGHNFTGADWTVQVAKVAKEAGVLAGIKNVDLNKPISREVAAQMIYNILFSKIVEYTPAFGYQAWMTGADDLATEEFNIVSDKDGDAANIAPWGRPATIWVAKDGTKAATAAVTIAATPVATYTTAVNECDLSKAVGETGTWNATQWHNGGKATSKIAIEATDVKNDVAGTAQGVLTEIYEVEKDVYEIVEIQTWMAEVTDVVKATYDAAGHEKNPAKTTLKAWNNNNTSTVSYADFAAETEAFAEDSYVLLNNSWFTDNAGKVTVGNVVYTPDLEEGVDYGVLNLTAATPVATGKMTAYNNTAKTSTIGGTVYNWAEKFGMGFKGTVGNTYDVYVDFYGNVIGIEVPATVYSYGIITDIAWENSFQSMNTAKAYADILSFTASADKAVVMDSIKDVADFSGVGPATNGDYSEATVSTTAAKNGEYYDVAYEFETLSDGSKVIIRQGTEFTGLDMKTGVSKWLASDAATNDATVYLVKTGNADDGYTYTSYTGYKTIPSMTNVDGYYFAEDNYVTYMFVDATDATFTGSTTIAYIADITIDGEDDGLYVYEMYVDGILVEKTSEYANLTEIGFTVHNPYEVSFDADGNVIGLAPVEDLLTIENVTACNGTVIKNGHYNKNCTDAPIYLINKTADDGREIEITTDYQKVVNKTVFAVMNDEGTQALALYVKNF